jgi:hypothetical protein
MSTRAIPPVNALGSRIEHVANLHGLQDGVSDDLGTFMAVALDVSPFDLNQSLVVMADPLSCTSQYHLSDMISSAIELKRTKQAEDATVALGERPEAEAMKLLERSPDNVSESLRPEEDDKMEGKKEFPKSLDVKLDANVISSQSDRDSPSDTPVPQLSENKSKTSQEKPLAATLNLADLEDFFTVAPYIHPHLGSATYRLRNGLARSVEEQEILAERLTKTHSTERDGISEEPQSIPPSRPSSAAAVSPVAVVVPPSSGTNSQSVTRANTPSSIHRKGAPTSLPLSNIPKIEINLATPEKPGLPTTAPAVQATGKVSQPSTPRLPVTGPGGIILSRNTRSTLNNPTEAFRMEMEARGILKSMDRAAGAQGGMQGGHGDGNDERQPHGHHWNYVDPAVILKDILG